MFSVEEADDRLEVRMPASLGSIDEADAALQAFLERVGPPVDRFAVRILAREALLNAVTHGSQQNPERQVRMDVALKEEGLSLAVEDEGQGFDWRSRNECFDITGDGGRGLPLMRIYSSRMDYNATGNRVELWRNYEEAASAKSSGCEVRKGDES